MEPFPKSHMLPVACLFLIMINDIKKDVPNSKVSLFSDDTRMMKSISSEHDVEDLQSDIDVIYRWQKENNMLLNNNKNRNDEVWQQWRPTNIHQLPEIKESLRELGFHQPHQACL